MHDMPDMPDTPDPPDPNDTSDPYAVIDLLKLASEGQRSLSFETAFHYDAALLPVTKPVLVRATISHRNTGCRVKGHFEAEVEEPCDRCSEPFLRQINQDFEETYVFYAVAHPPDSSRRGHQEIELQLDEMVDALNEDECLLFKELIYQLIVLACDQDRFCHRPACATAHALLAPDTPPDTGHTKLGELLGGYRLEGPDDNDDDT